MSDMDWQRADETQDLRPHLPDCIEHRAGLPFGCICDRLRKAE